MLPTTHTKWCDACHHKPTAPCPVPMQAHVAPLLLFTDTPQTWASVPSGNAGVNKVMQECQQGQGWACTHRTNHYTHACAPCCAGRAVARHWHQHPPIEAALRSFGVGSRFPITSKGRAIHLPRPSLPGWQLHRQWGPALWCSITYAQRALCSSGQGLAAALFCLGALTACWQRVGSHQEGQGLQHHPRGGRQLHGGGSSSCR
ncbi:hypothetical protein V8C86DRAFT_778683 [Haematococcus lacustris]